MVAYPTKRSAPKDAPIHTLHALSPAERGLVRRETLFGRDPKSGKRSLYQIADPFLRFWFRVVAPNRPLLAAAPRETRLDIWHRHRTHLEAYAWEELCRMAVSNLHRTVPAITAFGLLGEARRYWRGKEPELDVARRASAPPSRTRVADLVVSCSRRIGRGTTPMSSTREWCSKHSVGAIAVRRRKPKDRCVSPLQETYEIFDQAGREFRQASSDVIGAFAGTIRESLGVRVEGSLDTILKRHT